MLSWIFNILGLVAAWHYTDMTSDATFQSLICPILVALFIVILTIKLVLLFETRRLSGGHSRGGYSDGGGGFFGGGDSGGGDGGGGGGGGGGGE